MQLYLSYSFYLYECITLKGLGIHDHGWSWWMLVIMYMWKLIACNINEDEIKTKENWWDTIAAMKFLLNKYHSKRKEDLIAPFQWFIVNWTGDLLYLPKGMKWFELLLSIPSIYVWTCMCECVLKIDPLTLHLHSSIYSLIDRVYNL